MFAVVTSRRKLYSSEGDRTLERDLDGGLLHAVLPIQRRVARGRGYAAEIPLDWDAEAEWRALREADRDVTLQGELRAYLW